MNKLVCRQSLRPLCTPCSPRRSALLLRSSTQCPRLTSQPIRTFNSTPTFHKKANKASKSRDADDSSSSSSSSSAKSSNSSGTTEDPFDFSELEAALVRAQDRLKDDLSKLRAGGRFNPELVENLRVSLDKNSKETFKLGDLAQVVPRGRVLNLIAGDKDHLKPITSAILTSDLSLTPQPDAANSLQLNIPLPPPTKESRNQAVQAANKAADKAADAIRNARQAQQKKLRALALAKSARPDDLKKAGDRMEKVVEGGSAMVKKIVESARKVLESV